ncbi:MAG: maleylpyruvate isomerase family mycothiol-dependent enzyme [Hamadaea sp.]|uniref:maleylpyruvate isomerase family mycothiol-dependent enzyme n=1 Tax=Hamadaea sp. TaxID=2024425 RepID=UPI0017AA2585|nr:maleylpyruvate isomerase family mycothiol-dependent enzyme [Hamadaea sp.]NUR70589.1 maleylpyruvate isomerase family mycothiol-dependent enzyme [Hamadaea sp.]NUT19282.1 maleylpyruvate isomerase family mycothiol-dependent enzyme [Hamadaea sp.]
MSRTHGSKEFWLAALRPEISAFRSAAAEALDADPEIAVPSCLGWTILDLVHHLAYVYQRHLSHLSRGLTTDPQLPSIDDGTPADQRPAATEAIKLFDERAERLLTTLEALDPEMPAWNWAPQAKKVAFWDRRLALETAVHRWDAQMAIARAEPIEDRLAADGVSEVLDTWLPAGGTRRKGPADKIGVVHLLATDTGDEWFLRLRGQGVALLDTDTILDSEEPDPRVSASGTASDLLLAMYGRVGFDVLELAGDEFLLEALRVG